MKLTTCLLLLFLLNANAATKAQTLTVKGNGMTLEAFFKKIQEQTGYQVFWSPEQVNKNLVIDVNLSSTPLKKALDQTLVQQNLTYDFEKQTIVVRPADKQALVSADVLIDINGMVVDKDNIPLQGATIKLKNGSRATVTDKAGAFHLSGISSDATIIISFLGYKTIELKVAPNLGNIRLELQASMLGDVIISTGYQLLPKERATGSFKLITSEQLDKPASSLSERLIGTTSGMVATVSPTDGSATFQIRGLSTLGANGSPLIVIDGFAVNESDFSQINPNNVESVTILKDAAAASIWGARAANGVIVVTTKSAKRGISLSVDASAFTKIGNKFDVNYIRGLANSTQTVDYEKLAFQSWGGFSNNGTISSVNFVRSQASTLINENSLGFITADQMNAGLAQLRSQDNSSQISKLLLSTPITSQVDLNISGTSGTLSNAISMLYESNTFGFKNNSNKRVMVNYKASANIFKWLDFDTNFMGQYINADNNGVSLADIKNLSPYDMLQNADGSYTNIANHWYLPALTRYVPTAKFPYPDFSYNPAVDIDNRKVSAETLNARIQAGLTIKIIKGISLSSRIQYDNFNVFNRSLYNTQSDLVRFNADAYSIWDKTAAGTVTSIFPVGSTLNQNRVQTTGYTWRNQLNIDRKFGKDHGLNMILGTEARQSISQTFTNPTTYGYDDNTLTVGNFANGLGGTYPLFSTYRLVPWLTGATLPTIPYTNSFLYSTDRFASFFGNAAYTFKDKYTISASARTDASNLITEDPKYRYAPFWQVGGLWHLSREKFMNKPWIDELSLRLTYGYQGNVDRTTSFQPLISIGTTPDGSTGETINTISSYGNPSLRWEKTGQLNLGVDFVLFNGKLFGSIEAYQKNGRDLIAALSIPSVDGTSTQKLNNARMVNKGINIELGTIKQFFDKVTWKGNLSFAYNQNKITNLFASNYTYQALVGQSGVSGAYAESYDANTIWSFVYKGLVNNYPAVQGPNGSSFALSQTPTGDARTFLVASGTTVAPYSLGFINMFYVHDFTLSFTMTGKFGAVYRSQAFNNPVQPQSGRLLPNSRLSEVLNGDPNQIITLPAANDAAASAWNIYRPYMSYQIQSANVVRLQEASLTYNLKKVVARKLGLKGVDIYLKGNNLFKIINNKYSEDPEYPEGTIPLVGQYTLGLKVQL